MTSATDNCPDPDSCYRALLARDARFDGTPLDWARYLDQPHLVPLLEGQA